MNTNDRWIRYQEGDALLESRMFTEQILCTFYFNVLKVFTALVKCKQLLWNT